ncbi:MAG: HAD family hydrolase, partial [Eubacterium sp.]|nr:HAD family hydrolase [Eubacterium sp.]
EYVGIEDGLFGSDSFMKTEKTKNGDFYDVSSLEGSRPENVEVLGGGVSTFVNFLIEQGKR